MEVEHTHSMVEQEPVRAHSTDAEGDPASEPTTPGTEQEAGTEQSGEEGDASQEGDGGAGDAGED